MPPLVDGQGDVDAPQEDVVCPHCKKTFTAPLMTGAAERYRGFKCPHCKLFVPAARSAPNLNT
jgi:DNA-directed RNA polymerase subunit RPC12/RpoP